MSTTELKTMHQEHREWTSEDALWYDQLREWEAETDAAIGDLAKLEQTLRTHAGLLRTHAAAVRLYEQAPAEHEHELAEASRKGTCNSGCCSAKKHERESAEHTTQRRKHEEVKRVHHALMARWTLLLKALGDA